VLPKFGSEPLHWTWTDWTEPTVRFGSVRFRLLGCRFGSRFGDFWKSPNRVRTGSNRTIYPQNFMKIREVLEEKMNKYIYFEVVLRCKIVILLYLSQMSMVLCHFFCVRKGLKITFKQYIECDEMLSIWNVIFENYLCYIFMRSHWILVILDALESHWKYL